MASRLSRLRHPIPPARTGRWNVRAQTIGNSKVCRSRWNQQAVARAQTLEGISTQNHRGRKKIDRRGRRAAKLARVESPSPHVTPSPHHGTSRLGPTGTYQHPPNYLIRTTGSSNFAPQNPSNPRVKSNSIRTIEFEPGDHRSDDPLDQTDPSREKRNLVSQFPPKLTFDFHSKPNPTELVIPNRTTNYHPNNPLTLPRPTLRKQSKRQHRQLCAHTTSPSIRPQGKIKRGAKARSPSELPVPSATAPRVPTKKRGE